LGRGVLIDMRKRGKKCDGKQENIEEINGKEKLCINICKRGINQGKKWCAKSK
jgi:hypothetical protein